MLHEEKYEHQTQYDATVHETKVPIVNSNLNSFKGAVSRDFQTFFCFKDSTWVTYEQAKTVSQTFSFLRRYSIAKFENCVSA